MLTVTSVPNTVSYQWNNNLGTQATTPSISTSGTYTVTVMDQFTHCVDSVSVVVTVNPLP